MPPQTQGTIPADVIGSNQQPLPVSPPPVQDRAGLLQSVQSGIDQMNTDLQGVKAKRDTNESDVTNLLTGLGGQEKYKQQLEEQQGLTQLESQLSDVTSRIQANNRLSPARLLQAEQNVIGTGVTKGMLSNRLSNVERDNAIQSLVLAAEGDMIQGRVGAANARIERAMQAKFEPMKQEIEVKKFNLERLDNAVKEGQVRLDSKQQQKFNLQVSEIEKQEKDIADAQSIGTELIKNGAPAAMKEKIFAAQNKAELLTIPGIERYLTSPLERLQIAKEGLTIQKLKQEMSNSGAGGLTQDQRDQLLKDKTSQQAGSRIGVIKAIDYYRDKVSQYRNQPGPITPAQVAELNSILKTTVGSAINVAQGQGAMGDEESKRIMGDLQFGRLKTTDRISGVADSVIGAQDALLRNDLGFIDSAIPGASDNFQLFSDYKNQFKTPNDKFDTLQSEPIEINIQPSMAW